MQKQTPSVGRILAMVTFAVSCFGILLFLWFSFGGPIPLQAQGYRLKARIPESSLLVNEADVRIAGLTVGKVKKKTLQERGGQIVEMELEEQYAPVGVDTRAILRQKTLLGQIYIELAPGRRDSPRLPDGGTLGRVNVQPAVEIDELIGTFDKPTRRAFQGWVRELAKTIDGRSEDLNDAFGNLTPWATQGARLLERLDNQEPALHRLIRNSGIALAAVNQREGELRELIVNANDFFGALASRNDALAETISIFPTFLDESRATFTRLERFARNTRPLVRDLIPVATKLRPTVHDLGELAPDLERLFRNLGPLIEESDRNLPQAARFLRGAAPVLQALHLWLPEFNPILAFANFEQQQVADFITIGGGSINAWIPGLSGEGRRHYLRQFSTLASSRGVGLQQSRPNYERGNAYPEPNFYKRNRPLGILENFGDCKVTGEPGDGTKREPEDEAPAGGSDALAPCYVQPPQLWDNKFFPRLPKGFAPLRPPPVDNQGTKPPQP
jgi:phospholipid/cholesterol/gamma-HCH transport system substrate-binding protein